MNADDFLEHYGVKGMHWRHRKSGNLKPESAPGHGRLSGLNSAQRKFQIERLTSHLAELEKAREAAKPGTWHGHNAILRAQARLAVLKQEQQQEEDKKKAKPPSSGGKVSRLPPQHLRQSEFDEIDEFLEHHGRKGMRWGRHIFGGSSSGGSSGSSTKTHAKSIALSQKAKEHERLSVAHAKAARKLQDDHEELLKNGVQSSAFKKLYGDDAVKLGEWKFYAKYGESKAEALQHTSNDLRQLSNRYSHAANKHAKTASKLRKKADGVKHSGLDPEVESDILMHSDPEPEVESDFLAHFAVKGIQRDVQPLNSGHGLPVNAMPSKSTKNSQKIVAKKALLTAQAKQHSDLAKEHTKAMLSHRKDLKDLQDNGFKSETAKSRYGEHAHLQDPYAFYRDRGITKNEAYSQMHNRHVLEINRHASKATYHDQEAAKYTAKAANLQHGESDVDIDDFLEHFGRKGMRWGQHVFGGSRSGGSTHPASSDYQRFRSAHEIARTHGTHALSNDELRTLTERLNLEQNYRRLTASKSDIEKGHNFVKQVLSGAKTGLDIYNTSRQVQNALDELKKK
jgi:hypothetical protein